MGILTRVGLVLIFVCLSIGKKEGPGDISENKIRLKSWSFKSFETWTYAENPEEVKQCLKIITKTTFMED